MRRLQVAVIDTRRAEVDAVFDGPRAFESALDAAAFWNEDERRGFANAASIGDRWVVAVIGDELAVAA